MSLYRKITENRYNKILKEKEKLTDRNLKKYFNSCFDDLFSELGLYPCWVCTNCLRKGDPTYGWGKPEDRGIEKCRKCGKKTVYEVGTFQAWAKPSGDIFEFAFEKVITEISNIPLVRTPSARLYDFEVTNQVKIEAKGSAGSIRNPDGSVSKLKRPGLERSNSEKKAFSNAEEHKRDHPSHKFFIVSNAVPKDLTVEGRACDGVFNATKKDELQSFIQNCETHMGKTLSSYSE